MRLLLSEEMPPAMLDGDDLPRERADQMAYERGQLLYVGWHVFADLEDDGRHFRLGGSWGMERPISLNEDPTSALLEIVKEERYHLGNLFGDLRMGNMDVTRWEFYAAPFKVELSPQLQARLAGAWQGRAPEQAPSHEDFYDR